MSLYFGTNGISCTIVAPRAKQLEVLLYFELTRLSLSPYSLMARVSLERGGKWLGQKKGEHTTTMKEQDRLLGIFRTLEHDEKNGV